jgi:hypothetical protein
MDIDDAAGEFLGWGTFQQVGVLGSVDTFTAAALLTRSPEPLRKELLGMLEPYMAANIVQVRSFCFKIHASIVDGSAAMRRWVRLCV